MYPKSCRHSLLHLRKFFSVVFAHAVTLSSRAPSRQFESNKVLPNSDVHTCWLSQWGTPDNFGNPFDSASEPSAAMSNMHRCCCFVVVESPSLPSVFPFPVFLSPVSSCGFPFLVFIVVSLKLLGSTFASLCFPSPFRSRWTMLKVVPFITTWLGPFCISII